MRRCRRSGGGDEEVERRALDRQAPAEPVALDPAACGRLVRRVGDEAATSSIAIVRWQAQVVPCRREQSLVVVGAARTERPRVELLGEASEPGRSSQPLGHPPARRSRRGDRQARVRRPPGRADRPVGDVQASAGRRPARGVDDAVAGAVAHRAAAERVHGDRRANGPRRPPTAPAERLGQPRASPPRSPSKNARDAPSAFQSASSGSPRSSQPPAGDVAAHPSSGSIAADARAVAERAASSAPTCVSRRPRRRSRRRRAAARRTATGRPAARPPATATR